MCYGGGCAMTWERRRTAGARGGTMAEGVKPSQEGPRSDLSLATNPFRGGISVTVLAVLLFLSALSIDRATVMFMLFGVNFWSTTVAPILALLVDDTG